MLTPKAAGEGALAPCPEIAFGEISAHVLGPGPWFDPDRPTWAGPAGLDRLVLAQDLVAAGQPPERREGWSVATLTPAEFYGSRGELSWYQRRTCSGDIALTTGT